MTFGVYRIQTSKYPLHSRACSPLSNAHIHHCAPGYRGHRVDAKFYKEYGDWTAGVCWWEIDNAGAGGLEFVVSLPC